MKKSIKLFSFLFLILSLTCQAQSPSPWSMTGPVLFPTNISGQINGIGRVSQIKFHATNPLKMYAASASGGLWISTDGAQSWTKTGTDNMPATACASVCVNYNNDNIIYLGTGDANYYSQGFGIWKSTDGGQTWAASNTGMGNLLPIEILMDPSNENNLIVASDNGIYKSYNAGGTWVNKLSSGDFKDMKFNAQAGSSVIYAATSSEFYRSTDMGETWTQITNGTAPPGGNGQGMRIAVSKADPMVVYIGMVADEGYILKSTDGGLSFITVHDVPTVSITGYDVNGGGQGDYNFKICADPTDANILYSASHCVWKSIDGGITWNQLTQWYAVLHTDMHDIEISPFDNTKLFNANDGGVWLSTDGGTNWSPKSDGLDATECYHAASCPTQQSLVDIGTQDNGELYTLNNLWRTNRGGDWSSVETFDYSNNNTVYYHQNGNRQNLNLGGGEVSTGLPFTGADADVYEFTPLMPSLGFVGNTDVYRSTNLPNNPPTWTKISTFNKAIKAMASDPVDANILYVVTSDGKIRRTDSALATNPTFTTYALPAATNIIASVCVVNSNHNVVYVSTGSKVYVSQNKGATWTNVSTGLPSINIIKIYNNYYSTDESVYVGSAKGVYYKNNTLSSWQNYSGNLPTIADITDFMIYNNGASGSLLRVSYYGRGVWEMPLYSNLPPVADFVADKTLICPNNNIQFTDISIGSPTSWSWSFPGGTPATSTLQNPMVTYANPGVYNVTLVAGNANGTHTAVKTTYINVSGPQALPLIEGFEGSVFVPANWMLFDAGNNGINWQKNASVGGFSNSASSVFFDNYNIDATGSNDEIRTAKLNFSNITSAKLTFDVAYARYDNVNYDSLEVLVSNDCGLSFTSVYMKGGTALSTSGDNTGFFTPTNTEWRTDTVYLNAYVGQANILIAFKNIGHYGNALYLDNINILASSISAPVANFSASEITICAGQQLVFTDLSTGAPSSWSWSFTGGTPATSTVQQPTVTYNTPGTYNVSLTASNANGSNSLTQSSYIVVSSAPAIPTITSNGAALTSSAAVSYQWYLNGIIINGAVNQTYVAQQSGNYTVEVTNASGCYATSTAQPIVINGITEMVNDNTILVMPNPNNGEFIVKMNFTETNDYSIQIQNELGQVVHAEKLIRFSGEYSKPFSIAAFGKGIYFLQIKSSSTIQLKKIVVY